MSGNATSTMDRHGEQMRRMMSLGLFLFLGLLISGCGGSSTSRVCNTGDQLPCLCLGGGTGVQVCFVDGSGYGDECIGCTSGGGGGGGGSAGGGGGSAGGGGGSAGGGGGGSATCPAGWTLCGTACVDPTSNPMHCGTCANACPSGQVCQNSACKDWADCQQNPCPGLSYCDLGSGTCKAGCLTDSQCTTDETCDLGSHSCTCKTGFHRCSGVCLANNDAEHCGSSCSACPTDPHGTATCDGTSCGMACSSGTRYCAGACAACPSGNVGSTACSGSACIASTCSTGYLLCGSACAQCPTAGAGTTTACSGSTCVLKCSTTSNTLCGSRLLRHQHELEPLRHLLNRVRRRPELLQRQVQDHQQRRVELWLVRPCMQRRRCLLQQHVHRHELRHIQLRLLWPSLRPHVQPRTVLQAERHGLCLRRPLLRRRTVLWIPERRWLVFLQMRNLRRA